MSGCDVNACQLITFKPGLQEILLLLKYILLIVYAISCQGKIWGTIWLFWSRQLLVIAGFTLLFFFFFSLNYFEKKINRDYLAYVFEDFFL